MLPKHPTNRLLICIALLVALVGSISWLVNLFR